MWQSAVARWRQRNFQQVQHTLRPKTRFVRVISKSETVHSLPESMESSCTSGPKASQLTFYAPFFRDTNGSSRPNRRDAAIALEGLVGRVVRLEDTIRERETFNIHDQPSQVAGKMRESHTPNYGFSNESSCYKEPSILARISRW